MSFDIAIIGGSGFDSEISNLFKKFNIDIIHYDARKSSDLRKQNINKSTIGVIITVNRSHQAFGNSNEIVRTLKTEDIPYVFSSSNLASLNSAKILLEKISLKYPDIIKKDKTPLIEKELGFYRDEWKKTDSSFFKTLNEFMFVIDTWEKNLIDWQKVLNAWKESLIVWKDFVSIKTSKKKFGPKYSMFASWKEDIHNMGIELEKYINIAKDWKNQLDEEFNKSISNHKKLEIFIDETKEIKDKITKSNFKIWQEDLNNWQDNLYLLKNEYIEWQNYFVESFKVLPDWKKVYELWYSSFLREKALKSN